MMVLFNENRRREKISKFILIVSLISLLPFIGGVFGFINVPFCLFFIYLAKKFPEKFGGLTKLKISLVISFISILLSLIEFHQFFKYKIRESEELRNKITIMRLYSASEALEEYKAKLGEYPDCNTCSEVENLLDKYGIVHLPFKDGWERDFQIKSRKWDYKIEGKIVKNGKICDTIVVRAKSPSPIYPLVISPDEFKKLIVD